MNKKEQNLVHAFKTSACMSISTVEFIESLLGRTKETETGTSITFSSPVDAGCTYTRVLKTGYFEWTGGRI